MSVSLPLLALSLHYDDDLATGPKEGKQKAAYPKPYEKKPYEGFKAPLTQEMKKYMDAHWMDDSWRKDLIPPKTPNPPPGRLEWRKVKTKRNGVVLSESEEKEADNLEAAKAVARRLFGPGAAAPVYPVVGLEPFVPAPFVYPPPPPDPSGLDFETLKSLTGELSFGEVRARLNSEDQTWASKPSGEREALVRAMKVTIRTERLQKQITEYAEKRSAAEAAHASEQAAEKTAYDNKIAILQAQKSGAGMLLSTNATPKQQARALLRIHFQKKGVDGKARYWSTKPPPGRSQTPGVTKELDTARQKWASEQIAEMLASGTNPLEFLLNLQYPPLALYIEGADVVPNDHPTKSIASKEGQIPAFAGPILAVGSSSQPDGAKVFYYVKRREMSFAVSPPKFVPLGDDFAVLDEGRRSVATTALKDTYTDFLDTLVTFGATEKDLFGDTNEVLSYTQLSGRFNRTLRVPVAVATPFLPPDSEYTSEESTENVRALYMAIKNADTLYGPELQSFESFKIESLKRIHSLWRVMVIAPTLPVNIPVLRSVKNPNFLPHRLEGISDDDLKPGMAFLDKAFVSTALTGKEGYFGGELSFFFNNSTNCCMMSLNVSAGTPSVPLFLAGSKLSKYPAEQEVVLPPLCTYVYRASRQVPRGSTSFTLYHFDVYPSF